MSILCFVMFFTLSESRIVWVVGNGPLVRFSSHKNDVGVRARMDILEDLVFWALAALFLLTLFLVIIWITKYCRTKFDDSSRSEKSIGKESSSTTSTTLDITGNFPFIKT